MTAAATDSRSRSLHQRAGLRALGVGGDLCERLSQPNSVAGMTSDASRARRLGDVGATRPSLWGGAPATACRTSPCCSTPGRGDWRLGAGDRSAVRGRLRAHLAPVDAAGRSRAVRIRRRHFPAATRLERKRPVRDQEQLDYTNVAASASSCSAIRTNTATTRRAAARRPARPGRPLPRRRGRARSGRPRTQRQLPRDAPVAARTFEVSGASLDQQGGERAQTCANDVAAAMDGREPTSRCDGSSGGGVDPEPFTYRRIQRACAARSAPHPAQQSAQRRPAARRRRFSLAAGARWASTPTRSPTIWSLDALSSPAAPRPRIRCGAGVAATRSARRRAETGLHFICLAANITRQFEFVQSAWAMGRISTGSPAKATRCSATRLPRPAGTPPTASRSRAATGPTPHERAAAVRHRARRRLLLPARYSRPAFPRHHSLKGPP